MKIQRRLLVAALVLVFIAGLFGAAAAQVKKPAGKSPQALVPDLSVQAGTILEGQDYRHSFVVRNTGDAELQILNVRPG